jgi:CYTH domain-containing protein/thymidylate kinase
MSAVKIVITGGPCAGKTTGMSWIQHHLEHFGYKVLFVPETATELISGGVAPWTCGTNLDYQKCQLRLQKEKEEIFEMAAETMDRDKLIIVCDRGFMDNKAYMTDEEFEEAAAFIGKNPVELRDSYDAVFHLVTAAKGAEEYYTKANNGARYETVEQAAALDDKLIAAWTGHPHLRVIDNSTDFEDKLKRLVNEIIMFLGEPDPVEIERKYLIEYPDLAALDADPMCRKVEIVQTYLKAPEGEEYRVRRRGENGHYTYYETVKSTGGGIKRLQLERRLDEEHYLDLLDEADPECMPVEKTRYYLTYEKQYFEIDVYPFWKDRAIVEIELSSEDQEVIFPPQLKMIREVTGEKEFKNASLARRR